MILCLCVSCELQPMSNESYSRVTMEKYDNINLFGCDGSGKCFVI